MSEEGDSGNYYKGVDESRKVLVEQFDRKVEKLKTELARLQSANLVSYCKGMIAGVLWARKQTAVDGWTIPDPKADNEDDLLLPWNSLP